MPNNSFFIEVLVEWGLTGIGFISVYQVIFLMGIYFNQSKTFLSTLKLNKSKSTYPILTFLKNIDQTTSL